MLAFGTTHGYIENGLQTTIFDQDLLYLQKIQNEKEQNEIIPLIQQSSKLAKELAFDFLEVNKEMDKKIDNFFASTTAKDIDILDI
jgi:hypothetical protein